MELFNLDKSKQYIIVGVSKCGSTSFHKYLQQNGYNVEKCDGWFHLQEYIEGFGLSPHTKGKVPLVILRDPVERAWSHYHYLFQNKSVEDTPDEIKAKRLEEVSRKSCYTEYLGGWIDKGAHVFWHEEIKDLPGFPHENKTISKPELDSKTRKYIENYIMDEYYSFTQSLE